MTVGASVRSARTRAGWITRAVLICGAQQLACHRSPPPILFGPETGVVVLAPDGRITRLEPSAPDDAGRSRRPDLSAAVPGDNTALVVDGVTVRANAGEHFTQFLALDSDRDGDRDVVVLRARADESIAGLSFYRRDPAGFASVPIEGADEVSDARCTTARISSNTPRTIVVSYGCPLASSSDGGTENRASSLTTEHVVIALAPAPVVKLRVSELAPIPAGTALATDVQTVDRDSDGRDDVVITMAARRTGDREELAARASIVLLERPTGYARDTSEPEGSFNRLAASVRAMATRRRAPEAIAAVDRIVRLRRALCNDSGSARLRYGSDTGVTCGNSAALRGVAELLGRAYMAVGEMPAALALTRPETASELGVVTAERFMIDWRRATPIERDLVVRRGPNVGVLLDASPVVRASALAFEPPSAPVALQLRGTVNTRVTLATLELQTGEPGTINDVRVQSLDGSRALLGFFENCEGVIAAICSTAAAECMATSPSAAEPPPTATHVRITDLASPEIAARCLHEAAGGGTSLRTNAVRPIGFGREGLVVVYRGRLFRIGEGAALATPLGAGDPLGGPFSPGSSASQSGEYAAMTSNQGLFVRDRAGRWKLWTAPDLADRYRQLTDVTVSNDGRAVAAMQSGQLWVLERRAPGSAPSDAGATR